MKLIPRLLIFICLLFGASFVSAAEDDRFKGWAWSPNIGWISFNCSNTDYCDTIDYGVTIATNNTDVSGYAWSPNVGWIDFSGASFNAGTGVISGTASVLAGTTEADGWDGDIVLYDTSPIAYGGTVESDNEVAGYAWGDEVVGWISYNCENQSTCGTVDYQVVVEPFYFDFTANIGLTESDKVPYEGNVNLSWTTVGAVSCFASGAPATGWSSPPSKPAGEPSAGGETIVALDADTTFTLECEDALFRTIERDLLLYVDPPSPRLTISADDLNIPYNTSTTINWDAEYIASCTASGAWSGSKSVGIGQSESSGNLTALDNYFNLTCLSDNPGTYPDPVFDQVLVNVERLTLQFALEEENVPFADPTVLEWTSTYATSCTASDGAGTTWTSPASKGIVTDQPYSETIYKAGTTEPLDPGNYSFTMTCDGTLGQEEIVTAILKVGRNPNFSEEIGNDPDPQ